MNFLFCRLRWLAVLVFLVNGTVSGASEWRNVPLPARPLNIAENSGTLWVCGADSLFASSPDGGNTWTARHLVKDGLLFLTLGFRNEQFGFCRWGWRRAPADERWRQHVDRSQSPR